MSIRDAHKLYIGLGSNLDKPLQQLKTAYLTLSKHPAFSPIKVSRLYQSRAVGPGQQNDYLNAALLVSTEQSPSDCLKHLQEIERAHKRVRTERWGPRTLDLDILLFGSKTINEELLMVPHPRISERNFVVRPLLDIDPHITLPDGRPLQSIMNALGDEGLVLLTETLNSKSHN